MALNFLLKVRKKMPKILINKPEKISKISSEK